MFKMYIPSDCYPLDPDNLIILNKWEHPYSGKLLLEVGANDSHLANILSANGYNVLGVDLRDHTMQGGLNYVRVKGEFVRMSMAWKENQFDAIYSASVIEHFGIAYGDDGAPEGEMEWDITAMSRMWRLLKPGGLCYITVPYGRRFFVHGVDWRVYDKAAVESRLINPADLGFEVIEKSFFLSAECEVQTIDGFNIAEEVANQYSGHPPHVAVFLKMRKPL